MTKRLFGILGFGLLLSMVACAHYPGGDDEDDGACTGANCPTDGGPFCLHDDWCPEGQRCVDGTCVPPDGGMPPGCDSDADCLCGESCDEGVCVKTACCVDGDCPSGETCTPMTGECGPPDSCTCDTDCTCGSHCDGGACHPGCDDDGDCCGEDVCSNGACVPPPPGGCASDADCPDGKVCQDGTCVCGGDDDDGEDGWCKDGKVLLCHYPPGHPANRHEICVGLPAKPAHLAHGDSVGHCP